jgi:hypothetical protein
MRGCWDMRLRWWQRLALYRLLEVDQAGQLLWPDALVSTSRQVGKSTLLRGLAGWRMHTSRLGDCPVVLHTGKDLGVCLEVQRPVRSWAKASGLGYHVREANGQTEVGAPTGGRWLVRGQGSVYSYAVDLGLVDEGWAIQPVVVEDGLEPTMLEREQAQLVVFSTAHRRATPLVLLRRASMLASWGDPDSLLLEWSAPGTTQDLADREAWRMASPHWHLGREKLLARRLARVNRGVSEDPDEDDPVESFRAQFLNIWPTRRLVSTHRDEPLLSAEEWLPLGDLHAAPAAGAPLVVALEDWYGLGAAAAAATVLPDGRVLVWGGIHASRSEALAWCAWVIGAREGCQLLLGASMDQETASQAVPGVEVCPRGSSDTRSALPLLRSLARAQRLAHAEDPALTAQATSVRVVPAGSGGLALPHRGMRSDLLRAAAWAVQQVARPEASWQPFYAY